MGFVPFHTGLPHPLAKLLWTFALGYGFRLQVSRHGEANSDAIAATDAEPISTIMNDF